MTPTRIRVFGAELPIGQFLVARLAELGYDVVLDIKYQYLTPLNEFYNIIWEDKTKLYIFANYIFEAHERYLETEDLLWFRVEGVPISDFINFCLYCWGMNRGNRLTYDKQLEITPERIKKWKLTNLL